MTSAPSRLALSSLIASLLLAGCAHQQPAAPTAPVATRHTETVSSAPHRRPHQDKAVSDQVAADTSLPDHTGIAACDDYLSSYLACHRAAAIYSPEQLPIRYQAMRTSLLRDSKNPDVRPQLAARCNSLATQLRQALHGKSCAENAAPASGTP